MIWVGVAIIPVGLAVAGFGLWWAFRPSGRLRWLAALAAPIGIVAVLLGVILVCIPGFFAA